VAEPDSAEFALMVIDVAPRDAELLGYRGGVDQPRGRRPRRVDDGVLDRADDAVADQVGDASRELVDDLRRQSVGLQNGLRWAGARWGGSGRRSSADLRAGGRLGGGGNVWLSYASSF